MKKVADKIEKSYSDFIDIRLYKSYFSLCLLRSAKKNKVKKSVIFLVKKGYHKLEDYLVQPKPDYSKI